MDLPVYKLYMMKPTLDVLAMPPEKQQEAMKIRDQSMKDLGGRILLTLNTSWSNEQFTDMGLEYFPSLEALIEYHKCLAPLGWFSYFQSKHYLGWHVSEKGDFLPLTPPPPLQPGEDPIYKVVFAKMTQAYEEEREKADQMLAEQEKLREKLGAAHLGVYYSRASNEEWYIYGIERYPSMEALTQYYMYLETTGWFKYTQARSSLGKATGGEFAYLPPA